MFFTLETHGGIALSAPQVGENQQIAVIHIPEGIPALEPVKNLVLINPELEILIKHEQIWMWEHSPTIPGLVGKVQRYNNALVHYINENGELKRAGFYGYLSGLVQHQLDYFDGINYIDRMKDNLKDLSYKEEWEKFKINDDDVMTAGSFHPMQR